MASPSTSADEVTAKIDAAWPSASGGSAATRAVRLPRCNPSAVANSQPIAGLAPWNTPLPSTASQPAAALGLETKFIVAVLVARRAAAAPRLSRRGGEPVPRHAHG